MGSNLVAFLLSTDMQTEIVCPVRPSSASDAKNRILEEIRSASHVQGLILPTGWEVRLEIIVTEFDELPKVAADWAAKNLNISVEAFWHLASTITFENNGKLDVKAANRGSTQFALEAAGNLSAEVFNYFSTAYIAGKRTGRVDETPVDLSTATNNVYEKSKAESEELVTRTCHDKGLPYRIFRPSIVIGHSRTGRVNSSAGLYRMLDGMVKTVEITDRTDPNYRFERSNFRVDIDPNNWINMVPVDEVVESATALHKSGKASEDKIFHLVNTHDTSNADLLAACGERLGLELVSFEGSVDQADQYENIFNLSLRILKPYLNVPKRFDKTNVDEFLGKQPRDEWHPNQENLAKMIGWYLGNRVHPQRSPHPNKSR